MAAVVGKVVPFCLFLTMAINIAVLLVVAAVGTSPVAASITTSSGSCGQGGGGGCTSRSSRPALFMHASSSSPFSIRQQYIHQWQSLSSSRLQSRISSAVRSVSWEKRSTRATSPRQSLLLASSTNHGNSMDDSSQHAQQQLLMNDSMTTITPASTTSRNRNNHNQRPPRWQPQRRTTPSSTSTPTSYHYVGVDAMAAEMESASRKSIASNNYAQQQQQQFHHLDSYNSNNGYYHQDENNVEDDDDPHVMEFANYLLALQAELEMKLQEEENGASATTYDNNIIRNESETTFDPSSTTMSTRMSELHVQHHVADNNTDEINAQTTADIMGDKFLQMLSNEVQYKKLIKQSPYSLTDVEYSVLVQRFLDNFEDGMQKKNGKFAGMSKLKRMNMPREDRKTVVVVGTGWASHSFVKLASTYDLRIVVVSPVNHFVFTPMLASAAVGTVEYRSMTEPIRVTNPFIDNFVEGRAIGVDVDARKLIVQLTSMATVTGAFKGVAATAPCRLEPDPVLTPLVYDEDGMPRRDETQGAGGVIELYYDHLICAVGTASNSGVVPGAKEYCFNLKTAQDSKRLRTAIGEALELASRPDVQEYYYQENDEETRIQALEERRRRVRIAVVGGGPTGVELSGELCDFFRQVCREPDGAYHRLAEDVSVMLIHGGSDLLPSMDPELRERALHALRAQGVDVRLNTRLNEVGRDYIKVCKKGSDIIETIPLGCTIWAAGNAPVPFVRELLSQLPESAVGSGGRINVDQWMRCPTHSLDSFGSILVLGDVAYSEARYKYDPSPSPLPQTAQVAGQQGAFVARMLNRGYDLQQTPPKLPELTDSEAFSLLRVWLLARGLEESPGFNFLSLGLLAYVGQEEALNQVMLGNVPLFNYSGKIAFALWRSVYLAKQASSRNQALIAFDWLRTETFGRDITRL